MRRNAVSRLRRSDDLGATALEFAILAPLLLAILVGLVEFGLMYQGKLAVTSAAREGARLLAVQDGALWDASVVADAAYPLRVSDGLTISPNTSNADYVVVTVTYPWEWKILPIDALQLGQPPVLRGVATMRKE